MNKNERDDRYPPKKAESGNPSRYSFMKPAREPESRVRIEHADPQTLTDAIARVMANGDLISFTYTSDGGAICISVISGGSRHKVYAASIRELTDVLEALTL